MSVSLNLSTHCVTYLKLSKGTERYQASLLDNVANVDKWAQKPVYDIDEKVSDEEYGIKNVIDDRASDRKPPHVLRLTKKMLGQRVVVEAYSCRSSI